MKRRILAVLLLALLLSALSMPIVATAQEMVIQGAVIGDGGLTAAGGNGHYLWIYVCGGSEYKTGTSTLYRQKSDGGWERITSVSCSGYAYEISNDRYLTLTSGYYKVSVSATSSDGSYTHPEYYYI